MIIPDPNKYGVFQDVEEIESLNPYEADYLVARSDDVKNAPMKIIPRPRLNTFYFS